MNLESEIQNIIDEAYKILGSAKTENELDIKKAEFVGKKGKLTFVLKNLASLTIEEKKKF